MRLCKIVIGVKPAKRMFRVTSRGGEIVDSLIDAVGDRLPDDYFTVVARRPDGSFIRLNDELRTQFLSVDSDSIIFTKDYYENKAHYVAEQVFSEFGKVWQACQDVLKVKNIRRIGMVGEYRIIPPLQNASEALRTHLTKLEGRGHAAKFSMHFETRELTTGQTGLPDVTNSDFWNTIETYYDSELDTDHSDPGHVTAMLDVQRYYMPLFNSSVSEEVRKLSRKYESVVQQIKQRLTRLNLVSERAEHAEQV